MDIEKLLKEEKNRQLAHSKNPIIQLDKLNINNNIKIQYERSQSSKYQLSKLKMKKQKDQFLQSLFDIKNSSKRKVQQ